MRVSSPQRMELTAKVFRADGTVEDLHLARYDSRSWVRLWWRITGFVTGDKAGRITVKPDPSDGE